MLAALAAACTVATGAFAQDAPPAADAPAPAPAPAHADIVYDRLAPGFVRETKNAAGFGNGWERPNPWGEYTAYRLATNASGQRTWRIEQYLPIPNTDFAQGSTMYLVEGDDRALLIDTAQPSANPAERNLTALVRYLLGHDDDGSVRARPLDFVVANTHAHDDHTGENAQMAGRPVYFMDGDWPADAPSNYVPVREGGGATPHGGGTAAGEIALGGRNLRVIDMPPHTPGSVGYLDAENGMFFTGDAIGSGYPWLHWAPIADYAATMDRIAALTADMPDIAVLPAHFYQIDAQGRTDGPLGRQYILDQQASAHGIVDGSIEGMPAFAVGPGAVWGGTGSARLTYSLDKVDPPGAMPATHYRAIRIPGIGNWSRALVGEVPQAAVFGIASDLHLIRSSQGDTLFLIVGSRAALLIGTGSGAPGLEPLVKRLAGGLRIEVALLDESAAQTGGLGQLRPARIYRPAEGTVIDLGTDRRGMPVRIEAHALPGEGVTLLSTGDRAMFALTDPTAQRAVAPAALADWRRRTDGTYDILYTSDSPDWFRPPPK